MGLFSGGITSYPYENIIYEVYRKRNKCKKWYISVTIGIRLSKYLENNDIKQKMKHCHSQPKGKIITVREVCIIQRQHNVTSG